MSGSSSQGLRFAAFACGVGVLGGALCPPFDRLADRSFTAHMAQHMLLIFVAAPLLMFGAPLRFLLRALPPAHARRLALALRGGAWRALTNPVLAWFAFAATLWGTHFSPFYEGALRFAALHAAEHALYLVTAMLFWQAVIDPPPWSWSASYPARIVYVLATMPQCAFLGLALYQTTRPLYPAYVAEHGSIRAALSDQQAGGELMWLGGGLLLFSIFMLLAAAWARSERRLAQSMERIERVETAERTNSTEGVGRGASVEPADRGRRRNSIGVSPPIALALAAALACSLIPPAFAAGAPADDGRTLYSVHCASCHGANLEGTSDGPALGGVSAGTVDFFLSTGRMPAHVSYEESRRRPAAFTPAQMATLRAYVVSRSHGDPVLPHMTTSGDAAAGRALFVANCAACHGVAGNGGSIGYGWVAPPLRGVTAQQLVEAVRAGPGVMPRFDPHGLSDAQLGDVVAYVELLNEHMPNAGGFGLGDIGPVAEGAIAWFAMAALIVVVRRLGSND